MRFLALSQDTIGQVVAKTVYAQDGRALLKAGTVLSENLQASLRRWGYEHVYVQDELFPDLPPDIDIGDETRVVATASLREAVVSVARSSVVNVDPLRNAVEGIIADVLEDPQSLYYLSSIKSADDITFHHSINVTVVSLLLGQSQHLSRDHLLKLGLGAMLHDIGKTLIPEAILTKPDKLTPEEYELAKQHALLGYQLLHRQASVLTPLSTNVALSHHERLDGSGYPRQIRGDEIHLFSKIVAVADVWDALVSHRLYKTEWSPYEAANYFQKDHGNQFHPEIVGHLLRRMALFPIGSLVRLSDNRLGVVTSQNPADAHHPFVSIIADRQNRLAPEPLPLFWEADLSIASVLNNYPPEVEYQLRKRKSP